MSRQCIFAGLAIAGLAFLNTTPASAWVETGPTWRYSTAVYGDVKIGYPSVYGWSLPNRGVMVTGMLASKYETPFSSGVSARADVYLWRYNDNGRSWGSTPYTSKQVWNNQLGIIPRSKFPDVIFTDLPSGHYMVTVTISWWNFSAFGSIATMCASDCYRQFSFSSVSDYARLYLGDGSVVVGRGGYVTLS